MMIWVLTFPFHASYDLTGFLFGFDALDWGTDQICEDFVSSSDIFWDSFQLSTMNIFGCTKCAILRFKQSAGLNDYTLPDMVSGLYANHETILRGYNIFKATPFDAHDEGLAENLFLIDLS